MKFPSHYGLILTNYAPVIASFAVIIVSIPLWSDFNDGKEIDLNYKPKLFPSHNGLILTYMMSSGTIQMTMFPSHNDLILTDLLVSVIPKIFLFPSHYGLILTQNISILSTSTSIIVSIPLWSDFNFIVFSIRLFLSICFHPTMV